MCNESLKEMECHLLQAQVPPHLMPPPVLVDMDGNTHPLGQQIAITELICKPGTLKKEQWKNSNAKNQSTKSDLARGSTASSNTTGNLVNVWYQAIYVQI